MAKAHMPGLPGVQACTASGHADGRWVPRSTLPPYVMSAKDFFERLSSQAPPDNVVHGALSGCACNGSVAGGYTWQPRHCALESFTRESACALLSTRRIRQIVLVGDSITIQLYIALVMLLEGLGGFGPKASDDLRWNRLERAITEKAAAVCGGSVRVSYARNDLLTWSNSGLETNMVKQCDRSTISLPWASRAIHDADLLVLGQGIHFPAALHGRNQTAAAEAFSSNNLRHTLSRVVASRARYGMAPATVVLVGSPLPVPRCDSFTAPLTLSEANEWTEAHNHWGYAKQWAQLRRLNQVGQWLAGDIGVTFLDIAALSHTRPDAAVGRHGLNARRDTVDCVHTCLPGPVDEYVRLMLHTLRATGQMRVAKPRRAPLRFFDSFSALDWHDLRSLEAIGSGSHKRLVPRIPDEYLCLSSAPWFPFLECETGNQQARRQSCQKKLDRKTLDSMQPVAMQTCRGPSCSGPLQCAIAMCLYNDSAQFGICADVRFVHSNTQPQAMGNVVTRTKANSAV